MGKFLTNPLVFLIVSAAALFFGFSLYKTQQRIQISSEDVGVLEQEIAEMASEISDLEDTLTQATSSAHREKIIRDELLLQKPGEYVLQLPDMEEEVITASPSAAPSPWQEWHKLLF